VLGGLGSISGSVLAAVLLIALPEALREAQQYRLIVYALLLIVMMLVRPKGLFGVREVWDLFRPRGPKGTGGGGPVMPVAPTGGTASAGAPIGGGR
jgi:branched-chain amino acid transport system permease protein